MSTHSTEAWDDLPPSSDFFNSFFAGDLIDITNDDLEHGTSRDDEVENGMLVAMNAAAMDGDLFGSSAEFVPANVVSSATIPAPPVASESLDEAQGDGSAQTQKLAAKRSVTNEEEYAPAVKKAKAASEPNHPPSSAITRSAAASSVKPSTATSALLSSALPAGKPGVNPCNSLPSSIEVPAPSVSVQATNAASTVPSPINGLIKLPGRGVTHQVVPRPTPAPFANCKPAPSMTKAGGIVAQAAAHNKVQPMQVSSSGVKRALSEADFKNVASAAVSSLIQSASTGTTLKAKSLAGPKPTEKPVDTSTAHVLSLTSQSWITACSNPIPTPAPSNSEVDKAARNARRAALTQEERAKQNRDRNRQHARNTRLRKKAYVEELKRTLTELVAQRDAADVEKMHTAQREKEQREVRFRVMEEFLKLRGRNETNSARWMAILEDGFTLTLPRTNYRKSVKKGNEGIAACTKTNLEQVIRGAGPVMEDSQYLSDFLQTLGSSSNQAGQSNQAQIVYRCDRKRFFMDSNTSFIDFAASTSGAVNNGLQNEVVFKGSMRSSFNPASNKLVSVDITFDTGAIVHQLEMMGHTVVNYATEDDVAEAALAAVNAANQANALLDSLEMPQMFTEKLGGPVSVSSDDSSNHL